MKNINHVIKKTADSLDVDQELVKKVVMAYWKEAFYKMTRFQATTVSIRNVGNFYVSSVKMRRFLHKKIEWYRTLQADDKMDRAERERFMLITMEVIQQACVQRNIVATHFHNIFKSRREQQQNKELSESN